MRTTNQHEARSTSNEAGHQPNPEIRTRLGAVALRIRSWFAGISRPKNQLKRRTFIGAALVSVGGALGWLVRQNPRTAGPVKPAASARTSRFVYDVSEFETTDPSLLRYQPAGQFETGFDRVKRLASAPGNRVWVAGDRSVKLFTANGVLEREVHLDRPPHCLHAGANDELFIGLGSFLEVYDSSGARRLRTARLSENTFLTAVTVLGDAVYLADAGGREVLVCDRQSGVLIDRFGKRDVARNNPGFSVPSPYFDLAMANDGRLRIVNPGRLRIETYSPDGHFESAWGEPGLRIDRFCGCCNPVYFALTPRGDFITSEKGLARLNIYDAAGAFQGAVAGPDLLVEDKELAKRACSDCRIGAGFDVAVDEGGRVLALDPFRKVVRFFESIEEKRGA